MNILKSINSKYNYVHATCRLRVVNQSNKLLLSCDLLEKHRIENKSNENQPAIPVSLCRIFASFRLILHDLNWKVKKLLRYI